MTILKPLKDLLAKLHNWRRAALITFFALPLGFRAIQQYKRLPKLQPSLVEQFPKQVEIMSESVEETQEAKNETNLLGYLTVDSGQMTRSLPGLSIIIPARNEQDNLPGLLTSLIALEYPGFYEIIVVNDNSDDQTEMIARSFGVQIVNVHELPLGWLGKPHACHVGALNASGSWLLFTDADTTHSPEGAATAVRYALQHDLDGLSLFPKQEFRNWFDCLLLMNAFAGMFAGQNPHAQFLNGQYILIKRDIYIACGGFASVRNEPLEDLALGNLLQRSGYLSAMLEGSQIASVRMYTNSRQAWQGLTRLGTGTIRWSGLWSLLTALYITAVMSPLIVLTGVVTRNLHRAWLPVTWMVASISMFPWSQRFNGKYLSFLAPLGALLVQLSAVWGIINRLFGRKHSWKGRRV